MIIHKATEEELVQLVLDFADDQPQFDPSFAVSLQVKIRDHGGITTNQRDALERIIRRWHMVDWADENTTARRPNEARVH